MSRFSHDPEERVDRWIGGPAEETPGDGCVSRVREIEAKTIYTKPVIVEGFCSKELTFFFW